MTDEIIARLKPRIIVPHHYYIWDVVQRAATLQSADAWVAERPHRIVGRPTQVYSRERMDTLPNATTVDFFGDNVAFDKLAWRKGA